MYSVILAIALSGSVNPGTQVLTDPYGNVRVYSSQDLTVDNTWRNRMILGKMRNDRNDYMIKRTFKNPKTVTKKGYWYNF